tara:strand:- start:312 stop:869 length:558 start_codon:yes stop_codon:yes gene_type:complete
MHFAFGHARVTGMQYQRPTVQMGSSAKQRFDQGQPHAAFDQDTWNGFSSGQRWVIGKGGGEMCQATDGKKYVVTNHRILNVKDKRDKKAMKGATGDKKELMIRDLSSGKQAKKGKPRQLSEADSVRVKAHAALNTEGGVFEGRIQQRANAALRALQDHHAAGQLVAHVARQRAAGKTKGEKGGKK